MEVGVREAAAAAAAAVVVVAAAVVAAVVAATAAVVVKYAEYSRKRVDVEKAMAVCTLMI